MHQSLLLFIALLITLAISIYFGKQSVNVNEQFVEGARVLGRKKKTTTEEITEEDGTTPAPAATTPAPVVTTPTPSATTPAPAVTTPAPSVTTPVPAATTSVPAATTSVPAVTTPAPKVGNFTFTIEGGDLNNLLSLFKQSTENRNVNAENNKISDYYNWLTFWNTIANSDDKNVLLQTSNYTAKTSVVPNVSPTCRNCQSSGSNGACTNCGGFGGYGTSLSYKNRFSDFLATHGAGYRGQGNWSGYGGSDTSLGRLAEKTGSGIVDVTKTIANDATALAAGAGFGAFKLAEDTGSGAVGLLRDTGSGAVGLLRDTGSGAVGLLKDTGSGAASLLKTNPMQINQQTQQNQQNASNQSGYYSQGAQTNSPGGQKIDPYSYNGALVSKGGNYIPVTSDFSQFRK